MPLTAAAPGVNDPDVPPHVRAVIQTWVDTSRARGDNPVWGPHRWTVHDEHPQVIMSNDIVVVHHDYAVMPLVYSIGALVKPTFSASAHVAIGIYTPGPMPTVGHTNPGAGSPPGSEVDFFAPSAPQQTFSIHEARLHDAYRLSGACTDPVSGALAGVIGLTNNGRQTPDTGVIDSDPGDATFTANAGQPGGCDQTILDVYNQAIAEHVLTASALAPASSNVTIGLAGSGRPLSQTVTFGKQYHYAPIDLGFDGGCNGIASATQGIDHGTGTRSAVFEVTDVVVSAIANGSCTIGVTDQWGETATIPVNSASPAPTMTPTGTPSVLACDQRIPARAAGTPFLDGSGRVSDGYPCGYNDYILSGTTVLPFVPVPTGPSAAYDAYQACQSSGIAACALPDGTYTCSQVPGFSNADCGLLQATGGQGFDSAFGNNGTAVQNFNTYVTNFTTNQGGPNTTGGYEPLISGQRSSSTPRPAATQGPLVPATLVNFITPDYASTWKRCYVSNQFSAGTPDPAATNVNYLSHNGWAPYAETGYRAVRESAVSGGCPIWANN